MTNATTQPAFPLVALGVLAVSMTAACGSTRYEGQGPASPNGGWNGGEIAGADGAGTPGAAGDGGAGGELPMLGPLPETCGPGWGDYNPAQFTYSVSEESEDSNVRPKA